MTGTYSTPLAWCRGRRTRGACTTDVRRTWRRDGPARRAMAGRPPRSPVWWPAVPTSCLASRPTDPPASRRCRPGDCARP